MSDQQTNISAEPAPHQAPLPLSPLPAGTIPEQFAKSCDPTSPAPMRMMAARAMAPIPPKHLVPIIYQLMLDPDPKIAAAADKSFRALDEKLLTPVLADPQVPGPLLEALCHTLVGKHAVLERVLLNKNTPDAGFVHVAERADDEKIINVVVENQERLLRDISIVRALGKNPKVLRSDLDRAVDFLVREGLFLDDMPAFEDSFVRLGKAEMLAAMRKVQVRAEFLETERGVLDPDNLAGDAGILGPDEIEALLADDDSAPSHGKKRWHEMTKGEKMKFAISGGLEYALEAIKSPSKALAVAGINNPKITEADIPKIIRSKSLCEDVVRVICTNNDWTKHYEIKHALIQHPKTPISLVLRWLPLMRQSDLKSLAKSKSIPSNVAMQAKRLADTRGG